MASSVCFFLLAFEAVLDYLCAFAYVMQTFVSSSKLLLIQATCLGAGEGKKGRGLGYLCAVHILSLGF